MKRRTLLQNLLGLVALPPGRAGATPASGHRRLPEGERAGVPRHDDTAKSAAIRQQALRENGKASELRYGDTTAPVVSRQRLHAPAPLPPELLPLQATGSEP